MVGGAHPTKNSDINVCNITMQPSPRHSPGGRGGIFSERPMSQSSEHDQALGLVHQGGDHLRYQRPIAAWGAWNRALQIIPEFAAARQAFDARETATDLPASARAASHFRPAAG